MKRRAPLTASMALILVTGMGVLQGAAAQELINRREQARAAFLASPEGIYHHYCAHCHGDDGRGEGRLWASELSPSPPDLTALPAHKEYLLAAIREGSAAHGKSNLCPPWGGTISPAGLQRLAQYIMSLQGEGSPAEGEPVAFTPSAREAFPWMLLAVLVGEIVAVWLMLRRRKAAGDVVP